MTYSVRMVKAGVGLVAKRIGEGTQGEATVITAQPGVKYVIAQSWDSYSDHKGAPKKLMSKREGNDLKIAIDANDVAYPDLIIKDYFLFPAAPISGVGATGLAFDYGAVDASAASSSPVRADVAIAAAGDGLTPLADMTTLPSGPFASLGTVGQLGLIGGGLLVLGSIKTGGSGDAGSNNDSSAVAQAVITAYAQSGTNKAPADTDYYSLGVTGVTSANLAAINSAVNALTDVAVADKSKVQAVVDAYLKILNDAKSATDASGRTPATDPTAADWLAIGASIGIAGKDGVGGHAADALQAPALNLLDDWLIRKSSTDVSTITAINGVATVVDKVMTLSRGAPDPALALTAPDLVLLGISNVGTADNLAAIAQQIKLSADDGTGVDTVQELQAVVSQGTIIGYSANSPSATAPTLQDYTNIGISNPGLTTNNLGAVNSVIHSLSQVNVDTAVEVNNIITAWNRIATEANGSTPDATTDNPLLSDYTLIGLGSTMLASTNVGNNSSTTLGVDALALLNNAIGLKQRTDLSTLTSLTSLEHTVEKVMQLANVLNDPSAISNNVSGLTSSELTTLGVTLPSVVSEASPAKWNKFILLLENSTIDDVNSIDKIQAIASNQAVLLA